jgi:hypothetical protein
MLKNSKIISSKSKKKIVKENSEYLERSKKEEEKLQTHKTRCTFKTKEGSSSRSQDLD